MIKKFSEYMGDKTKEEVVAKPLEHKPETPEEKEDSQPHDIDSIVPEEKTVNKNVKKAEGTVEFFGKVAKFPKNVDAKKASNFLENIRVKKSKLWYLMVEKQTSEDGSELQMLKYNMHAGVNINKFLEDMKKYYIAKYPNLNEHLSKLAVEGDNKYSKIKNIPINVEIEGKKLITIITNDLVKLLAK